MMFAAISIILLLDLFSLTKARSYQAFAGAVTWDQAKAKCESIGSTLATVTNKADVQALYDTSGVSLNQWIWIGLNDLSSEGQWQWQDGSSCDYSGTCIASNGVTNAAVKWKPNEPNDLNNEDCGALLINSPTLALANDARCAWNGAITVCNAPQAEPFTYPGPFRPGNLANPEQIGTVEISSDMNIEITTTYIAGAWSPQTDLGIGESGSTQFFIKLQSNGIFITVNGETTHYNPSCSSEVVWYKKSRIYKIRGDELLFYDKIGECTLDSMTIPSLAQFKGLVVPVWGCVAGTDCNRVADVKDIYIGPPEAFTYPGPFRPGNLNNPEQIGSVEISSDMDIKLTTTYIAGAWSPQTDLGIGVSGSTELFIKLQSNGIFITVNGDTTHYNPIGICTGNNAVKTLTWKIRGNELSVYNNDGICADSMSIPSLAQFEGITIPVWGCVAGTDCNRVADVSDVYIGQPIFTYTNAKGEMFNLDFMDSLSDTGKSTQIGAYLFWGILVLLVVNIICFTIYCWNNKCKSSKKKGYKVVKYDSEVTDV